MAPMNALDTKAPQAFGSGRHAEVGYACERALICAAAICVPASALWWNAELVLLALGQSADASQLAARFLRGLLPVLPIQTSFEVGRRFLYAQDVSWPPLVAALVGVLCHIAWHAPCVHYLGFHGAAVSLLLTYSTTLLTLVAIVIRWRPFHPATLPHRPCAARFWRDRREWGSFLMLSLASLVNLSEWVFWEVRRTYTHDITHTHDIRMRISLDRHPRQLINGAPAAPPLPFRSSASSRADSARRPLRCMAWRTRCCRCSR